MQLNITIDDKAGFCFGVVNAINAVEENLKKYVKFYSLGDIVHNEEEIKRLNGKGLNVVNTKDVNNISNATILIRAHGEPPSTYNQLKENNNTIIDATCPIVLKLQERVKKASEEMNCVGGKIIIYGKHSHPEVDGLNGQTNNEAIIISKIEDCDGLDYSLPMRIFSQTTMSREVYASICNYIEVNAKELPTPNLNIKSHNTICGQVANRVPHLEVFAKTFDAFVFVSGENSSNGKYLYSIVKKVNKNAYFISSKRDIKKEWFYDDMSIGISGATSTPHWLLKDIESHLHSL